ncbi:aquaporin-like protein [Jimgerdemannia flammicorona]|uniref:Aquaporin-like protein n=1 Tax=Jimgerdemannia flammicorona TaxID=994334 RepID=A0A433D2I7_9FUNG|nr:aquaporin-like protein [Jimgerdemannia flammicorona]
MRRHRHVPPQRGPDGQFVEYFARIRIRYCFCRIPLGAYQRWSHIPRHNKCVFISYPMICFAIFKGFPWRRVPGYFVAQVIGAFLGAGFVWLNFYSTISNIDGGIHTITGLTKTGTSAIFVALPASYVSVGYQIWVEFFSDALFTFLVWMFIDTKSPAFIPSIAPILIGLIIAVVAMSTSLEGIVLNPARDLGPRIFAAIVYGPGVFTGGNYFFWIPLVVPFFGCITGAGLYDLMFQVYPRKGDPLPAH